MYFAVVNFIFVLPLSTKLSTNDPSCLLEMTGRERGVGTHKDMDIMEQSMVLSEKFHLSLLGEGRRATLLHKQKMCLFSPCKNSLLVRGKRNISPKFGLCWKYTSHFPRNGCTDVFDSPLIIV